MIEEKGSEKEKVKLMAHKNIHTARYSYSFMSYFEPNVRESKRMLPFSSQSFSMKRQIKQNEDEKLNPFSLLLIY